MGHNLPINGIPHLVYLGRVLEKGGKLAVTIFPEGWVLSQDIPINSNCIHTLFRCVKLEVFSEDTPRTVL